MIQISNSVARRRSSLLTLLPLAVALMATLSSCAPPGGGSAGEYEMSQTEFILNTVSFVVLACMAYYMLVMRHDQPQNTGDAEFLSKLKKGDEVTTTGGLVGKFIKKSDNIVTVEIAQNTRIRVIAAHVRPGPTAKVGEASGQADSNKKREKASKAEG